MTTIHAGLDIAKLNLQLHLAGRSTTCQHRRRSPPMRTLLAAQPGPTLSAKPPAVTNATSSRHCRMPRFPSVS